MPSKILLSTSVGSAIPDPYYDYVTLLLKGDGANNSQSFTDQSKYKHAITAVGNVVNSTSVVKYGTGSIYFDGAGDWLTLLDSAELSLGAGDYTIECWYYSTSPSDKYVGMYGKRMWNTGYTAAVYDNGSNGVMLFYDSAGPIGGGHMAEGYIGTTFRNKWSHLVWLRQSGVMKTYCNGSLVASATDTNDLTNSSIVSIGVSETGYTGEAVTGYLDEFRVTKGIARYTANFTPPTAGFPTQ